MFTIDDNSDLVLTTQFQFKTSPIIIRYINFYNHEWHFIGIINNSLYHLRFNNDGTLISDEAFLTKPNLKEALIKIISENACENIYFQDASCLYQYQKNENQLSRIIPAENISSWAVLNQDELLIAFKHGLLVRINVATRSRIELDTMPSAINLLTIKKTDLSPAVYFISNDFLYKIEIEPY